MRRYTDNLFRYLWLFILILLITPVLTSQLIKPQPNYKVKANFWVEQPLYVDIQRNLAGSPYGSSAQNQANFLIEFLQTRDYLRKVSGVAIKSGYNFSDAERGQLEYQISKEFKVKPVGQHVIAVEYNNNDPAFTLLITNYIVHDFHDWVMGLVLGQGEAAVRSFEKQVEEAKTDLENSKARRTQFATENPSLLALSEPNAPKEPVRIEDLNYAALVELENNASNRYEALNRQLQLVRLSYGAALSGQDTIIKILDEPKISEVVVYNNTGRMLVGGLLGFIAGLLFMILALLVITWTDHSIPEKNYARRVLNTMTVDLKEVYPRRGWRKRLPGRRRFCFRQSFGEQLASLRTRN